MKKPNVLFFLSDQHRYSVNGFAGNEIIHTPNLDQLASQSWNFSNAICQNPLCVPARSALLLGRYSKNNGIYENQDILDSFELTLPQYFKDNGYRTCVIGKTHFNGDQWHGYSERPYGDLNGQGHQPDPYRKVEFGESGLGTSFGNVGPTEIPLSMTQTEICVSEAVKWLQVHKDLHPHQPFFLSINFDKPHFPCRPPKELFEKYIDKVPLPECDQNHEQNDVPFVRLSKDKLDVTDKETKLYLESYYGCVEWVDRSVGSILEVLKYLELEEDTIVIYSSDHGDLGGDKGVWNKTLFYDASTKVPLLIKYKDFKPKVENGLAGHIDLFPTLCDLCKLEIPKNLDGINLLEEIPSDRILFCESAFIGQPAAAGCMLRFKNFKYNYYNDGFDELYDLKKDSFEKYNLTEHFEYHEVKTFCKKNLLEFWEPEKHMSRILATPKARKPKHCFPFSNQFVLDGGKIANARP